MGSNKGENTSSFANNNEDEGGTTNAAFCDDYANFGDKVIRRKSANAQGLQLDGNSLNGDLNKSSVVNHVYPPSSDPSNSPIDFDDILPLIGEFGIYQKLLFICMIPFAFFVAFVYFSQIFLTIIPDQHWCHIPELDNLTMPQR